MAKLSRDRTAGNLHPRENLFVSGNLASINAEIVTDTDGCGVVALDLRGTFNLTVEVAGTVDRVNYVPIALRPRTGGIYTLAAVGSAQGQWIGDCTGFVQVRARVTAFTSGSAAAVLSTVSLPFLDALASQVTANLVTATGGAGVAVTLTLPAPGAGLRQYLTYVSVTRFNATAAALTPATAPVIVTTTNLPGALAFSRAADALAAGAADPWREDFAFPLMASAQNAAVTIVCPLTTGVIWRATAGYYVAP
jgi:hypothetical protein